MPNRQAFAVVFLCSLVTFSCKKSDDKPSDGAAPDRDAPPAATASDVCSKLTSLGVAKGCRKGTHAPNGLTLPDPSKVVELFDFDAILPGGKSAPGEVFTVSTMQTRSRVVFGLPASHIKWNTGGVTVHIQANRTDDAAYEAYLKKIKAAMP